MSVYPDQPPAPQHPDPNQAAPQPTQPYPGPPDQTYQQPPHAYQQQPPTPQGSSGLGIVALVVGIIALFSSPYPFVGILVGLAAIGLGLAGRSRPGRKMALTGLWLGVAAVLVALGGLLPDDAEEPAADEDAAEPAEPAEVDAQAVQADTSEAAAAAEAEERASEFSSSIEQLSIGDCFTSVTVGETVFSLTEVGCSAEHEGEVVGAFTVEGMTEDEELAAEADRQCPPLVQDYLGDDVATFDGQVGYLFQTTGDPREVRCYITEAAAS